jgi:hypothetical protein
MGHVASSEMSLELILANSISVEVVVAISFPPVCYSPKPLVRHEEDLLAVGALSYLQHLLD